MLMLDKIKYFLCSLYYNLRGKILNQNPALQAAEYLKSIKDPIRIFVTGGPGFGDQVHAINLLESLQDHQGVVEIIGEYLENDASTTLRKIMTLLNIDEPLMDGVLKTQLTNGQEIHLISFDYFQTSNMTETELGIFVGTAKSIVYEYKAAFLDYEPQFTNIAKTKRVLIFDPFSIKNIEGSELSGFALQLKHQALKHYPLATVLPYKLVKPTQEIILKDLKNLAKHSPGKELVVKQIFAGQANGQLNTLVIYGLDPSLTNNKPEISLLNIIVSAAKANANANQDKQFSIIIMNIISDSSWYNLRQFISSKAIHTLSSSLQNFDAEFEFNFIDPGYNQTVLMSHKINIIRMGALSKNIFNELAVNSTYLMPYEGANAATLLANYQKWGLPCKRVNWPTPIDAHLLPDDLIEGGKYACTNQGLEIWLDKPTPDEVLVPLMQRYVNVTRPAMNQPDRFSYGLAEVSKAESCTQRPANCAFFKPAKNLSRVAMLGLSTTAKYGLYGFAEELTKRSLKKQFKLENADAAIGGFLMRFILQLGMEEHSRITTELLVILTCFNILAEKVATPKMVKILPPLIITLLPFMGQIISFDSDTCTLLLALLLVAALGDALGKSFVNLVLPDTDQTTSPRLG